MDVTITKEGADEFITIRTKLSPPRASQTGRTMLLVSDTRKAIVDWNGHPLTVGLNVYFPKGA